MSGPDLLQVRARRSDKRELRPCSASLAGGISMLDPPIGMLFDFARFTTLRVDLAVEHDRLVWTIVVPVALAIGQNPALFHPS